eukprot:TRINITY_DN1577_c0_g1_i4.p1 TRINITY_DN1577_c0_g1~~TRINITY_DN1577_c0_g1_i4.p1  ORF type:complete len:140 (-),score=28.78 TRINITY_DN1577_c0_g1_i4:456-875(-)
MFSPSEHPDFALVMCMRLLYSMATASSLFLPYWVADMLTQSTGSDDSKSTTRDIGFLMAGGAALVALPCGVLMRWLPRRVGLVAGLGTIAAVTVTWSFLPITIAVVVTAAIQGIGDGLYSTNSLCCVIQYPVGELLPCL